MCFSSFFSIFGLPFQVAAILHIIIKFSIFDTYREIVGLAQSYPPMWPRILAPFRPRFDFPSEPLVGVKRHSDS